MRHDISDNTSCNLSVSQLPCNRNVEQFTSWI